MAAITVTMCGFGWNGRRAELPSRSAWADDQSLGDLLDIEVPLASVMWVLRAFHVTGVPSPDLYSRGIDDARRRLALHSDPVRGRIHGCPSPATINSPILTSTPSQTKYPTRGVCPQDSGPRTENGPAHPSTTRNPDPCHHQLRNSGRTPTCGT